MATRACNPEERELAPFFPLHQELLRRHLDRRHLFLHGLIDAEATDTLLMQLELLQSEDAEAEAQRVDFERDSIVLFIRSPGGYCLEGLALVSAIEQSTTPVITVAQGPVASMALPIFLAGHLRCSYRHALFLYHQVSGSEYGMLQDRSESVAFDLRLQERIDEIVRRRSKIPAKKLREINQRKQDWWLFPEEAKEYGLVDEILPEGFKIKRRRASK